MASDGNISPPRTVSTPLYCVRIGSKCFEYTGLHTSVRVLASALGGVGLIRSASEKPPMSRFWSKIALFVYL